MDTIMLMQPVGEVSLVAILSSGGNKCFEFGPLRPLRGCCFDLEKHREVQIHAEKNHFVHGQVA